MFDHWRRWALVYLCGVLLTLFQGPAAAESPEDDATPGPLLFQIHDEVAAYPLGFVCLTRTVYSPTSAYMADLYEQLKPNLEQRIRSEQIDSTVQHELVKLLTDRHRGHDAWTTARFSGKGGSTLRMTRWYRDGECGFVSAEADGFQRRYHFALHHYLRDELVGSPTYPLREGPWSDRNVSEVEALDKMRADGIERTLRVSLPGTVDLRWGEPVSLRGPVDLDLLEPWPPEAYDRENNTFVSSSDLDYFNVFFLFGYVLIMWLGAGWLRRFRAARG